MVAATESCIPSGSPVLIAFGSNIDPLPNLLHGLRRLHQEIGLCAVSTVYRSEALSDQNDSELSTKEPATKEPEFLNGAVWVVGGMAPFSLRRLLRDIEEERQRVRTRRRYAPRTLDLDIALMGAWMITEAPLVIPDPDILHRPFLAIPLAELAPELQHPLEQVSLSRIAARFGACPKGLTVDHHATALLQAIAHQKPLVKE